MNNRPDEIEDEEDDTVELSDGFMDDLPDDDDQGDESDDDDQDDGQDEGDEGDGDEDGDGDDSAPAPAPRKNTLKDRIRELTEKRRAAERASFELELKNLELERQLAANGQAKAVEPPKKPDPKDFRYGEVDTAYVDAMVDYKVALRDQERQEQEQSTGRTNTEAQKNEIYRQKVQALLVDGEKKHRGFQEAVNSTIFEPELARMVLDSDNAVDIAFHLSKNIDDLRTLTRASAAERARILGRMEGRFSATSAVKKKTQAPEAIGGRRRKPVKTVDKRYGPEDQDAFDREFFNRG